MDASVYHSVLSCKWLYIRANENIRGVIYGMDTLENTHQVITKPQCPCCIFMPPLVARTIVVGLLTGLMSYLRKFLGLKTKRRPL